MPERTSKVRTPKDPPAARKTAPAETVTGATSADVNGISRLLSEAGLPHEDFAEHVARGHFFVARDERGEIVGAVGAELCGPDALLRSLVVAPARRGAGLGEKLVARLDQAANAWGVQRWWLLTTTAEEFFGQRGFRVTPRGEAPAAIAATREFRELCPSVAVCLSRESRSP